MSEISISTSHGLSMEQWESALFKQYLGELRYKPLMGTSMSSAMVVKENLMKGQGDTVNVGFRAALTGAGVTGTGALEGNEEALSFYNQQVAIDIIANAARIDGKMSEKRVAFSLREQAKEALAQWMAHKVENDIAVEFNSINGVTYGSASEVQKDAWLVANQDRVLFGASTANYSVGDHSASLQLVDGSTDVLTPATISLIKRMAKMASPKIEPIRVENGVEFYIALVHPYTFRDLIGHSTFSAAQREVFPRMGENHPLLKGQTFAYWDGVLVIEDPRILRLNDVGASSIDVSANVLLGAGSILYAQAGIDSQRISYVEESFDYNRKNGFSVSMCYGVEKARFNNKDRLVTFYSACVGD